MGDPHVITLMFHRVNDASQGFDPNQFERYLDYLVHHFPIVIPDEALPPNKTAICLTFDDAYYDFYLNVYPLLRKHHIKAILAVSAHYITEETNLAPEVRLSVPYGGNFSEALNKVPFCTWKELQEMADSGHVIVASHGFRHSNLACKKSNLEEEIIFSQKILQERLNTPIKHFVYPYGRLTRSVHKKVCQLYDYGIRIGGALNRGWGHPHRYIYRVNADPLWTSMQPITSAQIRRWIFHYWWNRVRLK